MIAESESAPEGYDGADSGGRGMPAVDAAVSERVQDAIDLLDAGDVGRARKLLASILDQS